MNGWRSTGRLVRGPPYRRSQGPDLGDSHTVTNRNRAPPRSRSTGPRHVRRNVGAYVLASLLHSQVPVATNQPSSRYCVW